MKWHSQVNQLIHVINRAGTITLGLCLLAASAGPARAEGDPNPRIFPPNATPHGLSYGELTARWWQWVMSIPEAQNPQADTTGEFCDVGQSGPIWFLGGTFGGGNVERSCTVPAGKTIFMPIFNWIFGAGVFDCQPTVPGVVCDVEALRASAAENTEKAEILEASIDGKPVRNPWAYRASSPEPFSVTFPEGAVFGIPAGTHYPHVADGYWLMIKPLPVGQHEIRIYLRAPDTAVGLIEGQVTYHLTVAPKPKVPKVIPPDGKINGNTYGEWAAKWWQWALGIPAEINPILDTTGENCHVGQRGPVWFLTGTTGDTGPVTRQCEVPRGKKLFFPIINSSWVTTCVGEPRTKEGLRPLVKPAIDAATGLTVEIDGVALPDLGQYRVESPLFCTQLTFYGVDHPSDLAAFCPGGTPDADCSNLPNPEEHFGTKKGYGPAITDGYWLMLPALSPGQHTIHFAAAGGNNVQDVTYHLVVAPEMEQGED